jgi:hypothetical protein
MMAFAPDQPFGARGSLVDVGPYPGLVRRRYAAVAVDAWGRFAFDNLHPGRWTLRTSADIPTDYRLDQTQVELDMRPGDSRDVVFRALPNRVAAKFQPTEEVPAVRSATPLPRADKSWVPPIVKHYYTVGTKDAGLMAGCPHDVRRRFALAENLAGESRSGDRPRTHPRRPAAEGAGKGPADGRGTRRKGRIHEAAETVHGR